MFLAVTSEIQGLFKWKGTKRRNNVTVSIFSCDTKGDCAAKPDI